SCTMKYNPRICEEISRWDSFAMTHPHQDESTIQGNLQIMYELEQMFCELTNMEYFTLQPAAGSQGEFTGLLLTRAYHESHNDFKRDEIILPDTSHGTNPASATMAGYRISEIPSTKDGTVDLNILEKTLSEKTACFMLTNPNTLGIFESDILEISKIVHEAGALLYYDGANMNAIMGKARPGDMGFDIVHLNLHKTFSTPHGGGGPGSGPIGVKKKLEPFLPIPRILKNKDTYCIDYNYSQSIGKIKEFYGNFSVLLKAYIYILLMGGDGLTETSEIAVLNANYMKKKLVDSKKYDLPYKELRKHEFVISCERLLKEKGVKALDVAKRLLDYGFHPPTVYFPLIVKEALMIEPTESESKKDLDNYIETLIKIAEENQETVKNAPSNSAVQRVDEAGAIKNPILTWKFL
ncbi:MAG: aminomethyl-transferring glycine dehydrogenase subunit GcvPB, partial [Thermoplasmatales archaeon]|nr:aminomethyl-transferring glycine dehydrogenase subunit GcvPB [Thermoplasmatales archaeon]